VQEPYTILNKVAGFPKGFKIFTRGSDRKRSAIIVNNNDIDDQLAFQEGLCSME